MITDKEVKEAIAQYEKHRQHYLKEEDKVAVDTLLEYIEQLEAEKQTVINKLEEEIEDQIEMQKHSIPESEDWIVANALEELAVRLLKICKGENKE